MNEEKNLDNCKELQLYWYLKKELVEKIKPQCNTFEYEEAVEPIGEYLLDIVNNSKDYISKDKIRERLKKLKEKEQELSDEQGYWGGSELQAKIEELEELLEEN